LPHVVIVAVVAYLLSGRTSIYPAQRLSGSGAAASPE
jgi:ABC-type lipoprotein release transport system permease subunit